VNSDHFTPSCGILYEMKNDNVMNYYEFRRMRKVTSFDCYMN